MHPGAGRAERLFHRALRIPSTSKGHKDVQRFKARENQSVAEITVPVGTKDGVGKG